MADLIDRAAAMAIARACERQNGPLTASGATDYGKGLSAAGQAIAHAIAALPAVNDDRLNKAVVALKGGDASPKPINWRDDPSAIVEDDDPQVGRDYA
jgi:hypothetical protein